MALVFAIMNLYNFFYILYCVFPFLFKIFFFNPVSINYTEWSTVPACPSLMSSFKWGNIEGTNSSVSDVCVYVCFMFAK